MELVSGIHEEMAERYRPRRCTVPVTFFSSAETADVAGQLLRWTELTGLPVEAVETRAAHNDMLSGSALDSIVARLRQNHQ